MSDEAERQHWEQAIAEGRQLRAMRLATIEREIAGALRADNDRAVYAFRCEQQAIYAHQQDDVAWAERLAALRPLRAAALRWGKARQAMEAFDAPRLGMAYSQEAYEAMVAARREYGAAREALDALALALAAAEGPG